MELEIKSARKKPIVIEDLYALSIKALWKTFNSDHISFRLLLVYFFFEYVRPQSLYPVIDIIPWTKLILIMLLFTVFLDKSIHWRSNALNKQFIIFCLIVIASGFNAFSPTVSWEERTVLLNWFLLYFLVINIVNTEKRLLLFVLAYLLFNFKMAQHGTLSFAARGFAFTSWGLIGSPGWFRNSGEFAIQMLIFGSLVVSVVISLKDYWGKYKKWFMYFAASTGFICVIGASSRGAQVGLAAIMLMFVLKLKGGFKGLILLAIFSYALYQVIPDEQLQRFSNMGQDNTSLQRFAYWEVGMSIIDEFPILGIGYFNWMKYVGYLYPDGVGVYGIVQLPHNIYIQVAAEQGYLGLISFVIMVFTAFYLNIKTRRTTEHLENKFLYNLTYGLDAGLVGYLVAGTFVTVFYYPYFWVQISMIVALYSVAHLKEPKKKMYKDSNSF